MFICFFWQWKRELELWRHGLKLLKRSPSSFTPCLDGRYLLLGPNKDLNHSEISKFSKQDADAYPRSFYAIFSFLYVIYSLISCVMNGESNSESLALIGC